MSLLVHHENELLKGDYIFLQVLTGVSKSDIDTPYLSLDFLKDSENLTLSPQFIQ